MNENLDWALVVNTSAIKERISVLMARKNSHNFNCLNDNQRTVLTVIQNFSKEIQGNTFTREQLRSALTEHLDIDARDTTITDFCYNKVNKEDSPCKFLISPERGVFEFVGQCFFSPKIINIEWKITALKSSFKIGTYTNGIYNWDFTNLLNLLNRIDNHKDKS